MNGDICEDIKLVERIGLFTVILKLFNFLIESSRLKMKSFLKKEVIRLLEDNGYIIRESDSELRIRHSAFVRNFIAVVSVIVIISGLFFTLAFLLFGSLVTLFGVIVLYTSLRKSSGRSVLIFNLDSRSLQIKRGNKEIIIPFRKIRDIKVSSQFMDEYATASRETTKEYHHSISLDTPGDELRILRIIGDREQPSELFNQLVFNLRKLLDLDRKAAVYEY